MKKFKATTESTGKRKKKELATAIIDFLNENIDKQFNYKQIAAALNVSAEEGRETLPYVLDKLRDEDLILETSRGKYKSNKKEIRK